MTPMVPHQGKCSASRNPGKDALSHLSVTRKLPIQAPRCITVCYSSPHLEGQHQRLARVWGNQNSLMAGGNAKLSPPILNSTLSVFQGKKNMCIIWFNNHTL